MNLIQLFFGILAVLFILLFAVAGIESRWNGYECEQEEVFNDTT